MKKQFKKSSIVIVILFFAVSLSAQTGENTKKYDLKYKMKKNKEFTFINMGYGNTYRKNDDSFDFYFSRTRELIQDYKVLSSNNNGIDFELEYKKMVFNDKDSQGKITVTNFEPVIGKKVRYTMSPTGYLSNFEGFDGMPNISYGRGVFRGGLFKEEITHMFPVFPERPVSIGDTWSRKAFAYNIEYRLINEMKVYGYDCVRIFAKMEPDRNFFIRKNSNGDDTIIEDIKPYCDIYYFAYKEGMIIYRISSQSYRDRKIRNLENNTLTHSIMDQLWETFVFFKN